MKYVIDIPDNKISFAEEFFKAISFIKTFKRVQPNEISNPNVLQSINDYENGKVQPTLLNLEDLKELLNNA